MNIYGDARKVTEDAGNDAKYVAQVAVDVSMENTYAEAHGKVRVPYDMEFEHREFGIKGIYVTPRGMVTVQYMIEAEGRDDMVDKEVEVDLSKLRIEWVEGGGFAPVEMYIILNNDGTVNYDQSYIEFAYLKP